MNVIILLFHISDNKFEGYTPQRFLRCVNIQSDTQVSLFFIALFQSISPRPQTCLVLLGWYHAENH